jgi:hypothetical protein
VLKNPGAAKRVTRPAGRVGDVRRTVAEVKRSLPQETATHPSALN